MNAFQEVTSEKHLPIHACAVCAQLTSDELSRLVLETDKMIEVLKDTSGKLIVDKCGKIGRQYRICNTCDGSLKCGNCPKVAIFNRFDVGCNHDMPAYLKNLTETEEMFIAKSRPFGKVRKLGKIWNSSVNYRQIGGHVIIIPEEVSTVYTVLPSRSLMQSLAEVVKVIWVGKEQPSYKDLKPFLEVRKKVVWQVLIGLRRDNPVYADVEI